MHVPYWLASVAAFAAVVALGRYVAAREPMRLDVEAVALRGVGVGPAAIFTLLGRWYCITFVIALALASALALHRMPWGVVAIALTQALSQTAAAALKRTLHRVRPDYWLKWREADTSYPSGHATTASAFYLALFLLAWHAGGISPQLRDGALILFGACVVGLPWSRLALGAHYLSDIVGGWLFGLGWLFALLALGEAVVRVT